jgi:hypothetical protein
MVRARHRARFAAFYLAHPHLVGWSGARSSTSGGTLTECMRIMRREAGHTSPMAALNRASVATLFGKS